MKTLYCIAILIACVSGGLVYDYSSYHPQLFDLSEDQESVEDYNDKIMSPRLAELESDDTLADLVIDGDQLNSEERDDGKLIYIVVGGPEETGTTPAGKTETELDAETTAETVDYDSRDCNCARSIVSRTTCEDGWVTFGNKCLKLMYTPETYIKAYNICRDDHNARIFSIHSAEEQTFFEKFFIETLIRITQGSSLNLVYLGMERCPHTGFNWIGQDEIKITLTYENWDNEQPQSMRGVGAEACAVMSLSDRPNVNVSFGKWHDYGCDARLIFVCEK